MTSLNLVCVLVCACVRACVCVWCVRACIICLCPLVHLSVISKLASPLTAAFEAAVLGSPGGQHGDGHVQVTNIQLHVDPHG